MSTLPIYICPYNGALAEIIRSHALIKGISIRGDLHIITLFPDDIILTLADPAQSLPAVHKVLHMFNLVSYYKVNASWESL